ncbi:MAG: GtrA family protein [Dysgonamonadaceae bacterium]|jgi:putative flippase GtrA|nr:GtrA family protein [Dysgonamonadaceae bacterium]
MKALIQKYLQKYRQLILYGIIGCFCAGLDFVVYSILTQFAGLSYLCANVISVHCGIFASFFLNRQFTFGIKNKTALRFISFYIIGLIGLAISSGLLIFLVKTMQVNELISKAITVVVVALIQFLLNKYISFKHGK